MRLLDGDLLVFFTLSLTPTFFLLNFLHGLLLIESLHRGFRAQIPRSLRFRYPRLCQFGSPKPHWYL